LNTFKLAVRYRVAYYQSGPKAGQTEIVVILDDKSTYKYSALTPESAHHLVDLLRNEKPIWLDQQTGMLVVAEEPVGSGEE
jgi:hypothetical protein